MSLWKKIKNYQKKYGERYKEYFCRVYKIGTKVQWSEKQSKYQRKEKNDLLWFPRNEFVIISNVYSEFREVLLVDTDGNFIPELKKKNSRVDWERIRLFHPNFKKKLTTSI